MKVWKKCEVLFLTVLLCITMMAVPVLAASDSQDYECAINNYWYSKFAQEPINSEFWEKAHRYAKKFPFNHTCSVIVKEYRELKKGSK